MDDNQVVERIEELAAEERRLEQSHAGEELSEEDAARLRSLEIALDQCWDLLRQRRARRTVGEDPDGAEVRPPEVVERYRQ
jgi:hypothetical protein